MRYTLFTCLLLFVSKLCLNDLSPDILKYFFPDTYSLYPKLRETPKISVTFTCLVTILKLNELPQSRVMGLCKAFAIFIMNLESIAPKYFQFRITFAKLVPSDAELAVCSGTEDSAPLQLEPLFVRFAALHQAKLTSCLDVTINFDAVVVTFAFILPLELNMGVRLY